MSENTVQDLVSQAVENNPSKMGDLFNDMILQRVVDAVSQRKQEIAQQLFDDEQDAEEIADEEEVSDEDLEQLETEDDDEDTETDA